MSDVTRILERIESGDPSAADQLLPLVYEELRKLAAARLAQEKPGQTLQATALVHEAYLRLVGAGARGSGLGVEASLSDQSPLAPNPETRTPSFSSRGHFFGAAAEAMRRILVEQARRKGRLRHGGGRQRVDLDSRVDMGQATDENLIALDQSLQQLEQDEPEAAAVVKLRYFAGLTIEEAARALDISVRTANRHWAYARAWLYQHMS